MIVSGGRQRDSAIHTHAPILTQTPHTAIFKMDNQQVSTVQHMELSQSYVAAWMGGEFGGEWIHIYGWLDPFAVYLKLSQHC